jgi:cytochrome d ubiquinol oxidase subunit II
VAGLGSIVLLVVRRYGLARITSSVAVATILIGWAVAQYPYLLLPYLTIEDAAGSRGTLVAMTVVLVLGSLVLVPALVYMFVLFSRPPRPDAAEPEPPSGRDRDRAGAPIGRNSGGMRSSAT